MSLNTVSNFNIIWIEWGRRVIGISGSLIYSKTLMELIFNPCGDVCMYVYWRF